MKKTIFISMLLFGTSLAYAQTKADEQALVQMVDNLADAWTAGDGEKWSEEFADEHDFVVWFGLYMPNINPKRNELNHNQIFNTIYENTVQYAVVDKIRFIKEDVALIHVLAAVAKEGEPRPEYPDVLWTGVVEKKESNWKIVSFHNLDLEIVESNDMQRMSRVSIDEMFASWK